MKKFLYLVCFLLILTACGVEESKEAREIPDKQKVVVGDKETITFTEGINFDTLCFHGMDVVTEYDVKQKYGCTSDMEQMTDILSRLDKIPTKEPTHEEEVERMEAVAKTSNYQIFLGQGVNIDNSLYTITVFEDGIIQFDDEGLPGIAQGNITIDAHVDKYNEIKELLYVFGEDSVK